MTTSVMTISVTTISVMTISVTTISVMTRWRSFGIRASGDDGEMMTQRRWGDGGAGSDDGGVYTCPTPGDLSPALHLPYICLVSAARPPNIPPQLAVIDAFISDDYNSDGCISDDCISDGSRPAPRPSAPPQPDTHQVPLPSFRIRCKSGENQV